MVENFNEDLRIDKMSSEADFVQIVDRGKCFVTIGDTELEKFEGSIGVQRIHFASERRDDEDKRVDSRKHKNWSSIGSQCVLSSRLIWDCDSNEVFVRIWISFIDGEKHWVKQARDRNIRDTGKSQNQR